MTWTRKRTYAALLAFGACVLLYRVIALLTGGALVVLEPWVSALAIAEGAIDIVVLVASLRWLARGTDQIETIALRFGAAAAILHALRVLVFVAGRTGPLLNFDVRPEHQLLHATRWSWGEVYFAAIMSVLGIVGVLAIWLIRRRQKNLKH